MSEVAPRIVIRPLWSGVKSRLADHLTTTVVTQVAILGLGSVSGVVAARLLGPQGRGELAALTLWPLMLVSLAAMGINQSIVFHTGKKLWAPSEVWTASWIIGLGQSILVVAVGVPMISLALRHYPSDVRKLSYVFLGFAPIIIMGGYPGNIFQGGLKLNRFNLLRVLPGAIYTAGLLFLFLSRRTALTGVLSFQLLGYLAAFAGGYLLLWRSGVVRYQWSSSALRRLFSFGFKTQIGNASTLVNRSLDQLLLSLFVAPRQLGLYAVAVTVAAAVGVVPQAAGIVTLASGSNAEGEEAKRIVCRNFRVTLAWLMLTCGSLFFLAGPLIKFAFGPAFAGSTVACRILLPGMLALGLNQVLFDGARSFGQPALPSYAEGVAAGLTMLGLYLLLPMYGIVGAAIASTCAYGGSFAIMLLLTRRKMGLGAWELIVGGRGSALETFMASKTEGAAFSEVETGT